MGRHDLTNKNTRTMTMANLNSLKDKSKRLFFYINNDFCQLLLADFAEFWLCWIDEAAFGDPWLWCKLLFFAVANTMSSRSRLVTIFFLSVICPVDCFYITYITYFNLKKIKRFVYLKFNSICIRNAIMTLWLYNKLGNCEFRLLQISARNVNRLLFVNTDSPLFTDCQIIFSENNLLWFDFTNLANQGWHEWASKNYNLCCKF